MSTRSLQPSPPTGHHLEDEAPDQDTRAAKAIMVLLVYAMMLFAAAGGLAWYGGLDRADRFSEMARAIFTTYIVPFEVLGFLLLAGLLGALYIAAREGGR